jgi:hypothetical protein
MSVVGILGLGRKNEFVFYSHETEKPFVPKSRKPGSDVAYLTSRLCVPVVGLGSGYSDSPAVTRTFDYHDNHALHASESRSKRNAVAKLEVNGDNLVTVCSTYRSHT